MIACGNGNQIQSQLATGAPHVARFVTQMNTAREEILASRGGKVSIGRQSLAPSGFLGGVPSASLLLLARLLPCLPGRKFRTSLLDPFLLLLRYRLSLLFLLRCALIRRRRTLQRTSADQQIEGSHVIGTGFITGQPGGSRQSWYRRFASFSRSSHCATLSQPSSSREENPSSDAWLPPQPMTNKLRRVERSIVASMQEPSRHPKRASPQKRR